MDLTAEDDILHSTVNQLTGAFEVLVDDMDRDEVELLSSSVQNLDDKRSWTRRPCMQVERHH